MLTNFSKVIQLISETVKTIHIALVSKKHFLKKLKIKVFCTNLLYCGLYERMSVRLRTEQGPQSLVTES